MPNIAEIFRTIKTILAYYLVPTRRLVPARELQENYSNKKNVYYYIAFVWYNITDIAFYCKVHIRIQ